MALYLQERMFSLSLLPKPPGNGSTPSGSISPADRARQIAVLEEQLARVQEYLSEAFQRGRQDDVVLLQRSAEELQAEILRLRSA